MDGQRARYLLRTPDRTIEVGPDGVRIGSGANCDVVLTDPLVAEEHAQIAVTAHGLTLTVLGEGGLELSGLRASGPVRFHVDPSPNPIALTLGDGLRIGRAHLALVDSKALRQDCIVFRHSPESVNSVGSSWTLNLDILPSVLKRVRELNRPDDAQRICRRMMQIVDDADLRTPSPLEAREAVDRVARCLMEAVSTDRHLADWVAATYARGEFDVPSEIGDWLRRTRT